MSIKPVVVGVDGSESALRAVRWAAMEAAARKIPLRIVHACMPVDGRSPSPMPPSMADTVVAAGRQWLTIAADVAKETWDDVSTELVREYEVDALIRGSQDAQLMVLGARGHGGFAELLIGSVAVAVSARGHCPVVVVQGADVDRTGKPIVVGVDGSPASEGAIAFAFDEASRRDVPLVAVHTWSDPVTASAFAMAPFAVDWYEVRTEEEQLLAERVAGWQEKYPNVRVQRVVTHDHPARTLIDQARNAQLVVVGSRGRGPVAGMLLGSTSQALLHHAPCPVAVVRPDEP
ncbi:universal stress protein [Actinocrispum wychmicini]|uniref:Nucleotide-binding universal stress UspA family protein n=1 Tax=Actinocrispum wychmicini TaxID=1213861 RepID=A0A4R2JSP7_9PSEU|nr:universal stress protein [Actinocrispum wychmicini]TCO61952.1 nucleotide-binding universal stress UspA family protein [Actinocrispum wychmicini]